jgi:hypothetical protein
MLASRRHRRGQRERVALCSFSSQAQTSCRIRTIVFSQHPLSTSVSTTPHRSQTARVVFIETVA